MALITLFSAPKAFTDPATAVAQRNAIQSWRRLGDVDVLLLGDEPGLSEAAQETGVRHQPQVRVNANRVPLISSMLELARETSDSPFLSIINTDIILLRDFAAAVAQLARLQAEGALPARWMLLSRRWDLDVPSAIDFNARWEQRLRAVVRARGHLHRPTGSDFFVFPRDCYTDVPDFAIGRAGWDNWMIYKARSEGWPVIDGTPSVTVIHQSHDYRHLPGGQPHYNHPDTAVNTRLAGGQAAIRYTILDATQVLKHGRLRRPSLTWGRLLRGVELLLRRALFFLPESTVEKIVRPQRWNKLLKRRLGKTEAENR
jgi:hypothetical protein